MAKTFTVTMLLSAFLLFLVEPMFARMMLPLLGGSPAVWNTAVVFYQTSLLAGYIYAHGATRALGARRQAGLHLGLLLLPLLVLPIAIPAGQTPPTANDPIPWILLLMLTRVGLPFIILSASSPLLQKWFADTCHPAAADPYFLYAASNAGSMAGLLAYPFLFEPILRLQEQSWLWTAGYGLLVVLMAICAVTLWRSRRPAGLRGPQRAEMPATDPRGATAGERPSWRRRARWVILAFVPSSLMLSVTTFLSTDIPSLPLLWVIPLALYLLSFILVFARTQVISQSALRKLLPVLLVPQAITMALPSLWPIWLLIPLHLAVFLAIALLCHGAIAADRPSAAHLTDFYLWLSVGGALGGMFNGLLAPVLFTTVLEYPLGLILAAWLVMPRLEPSARPGARLVEGRPTRRRWNPRRSRGLARRGAARTRGRSGDRSADRAAGRAGSANRTPAHGARLADGAGVHDLFCLRGQPRQRRVCRAQLFRREPGAR